jgi:hypothetical protein
VQELKDYDGLRLVLSLFRYGVSLEKESAWKKDLTSEALKEIDTHSVSLRLLNEMDEAAFHKEQNDKIMGVFRELMPMSVVPLCDLLFKRSVESLPFEWYLQPG